MTTKMVCFVENYFTLFYERSNVMSKPCCRSWRGYGYPSVMVTLNQSHDPSFFKTRGLLYAWTFPAGNISELACISKLSWDIYSSKADKPLIFCRPILTRWLERFHFLHTRCHQREESGRAGEISHQDVMTWKHFPHYWPFVHGIHL